MNRNNLLSKILGKLSRFVRKEHNMYTHPAEKFYFDLYWQHLEQHINPSSRILEIGCHHGRFTIPMAKMGYQIYATDRYSDKFDSIRKEIGETEAITLSEETIQQTIANTSLDGFDSVLCLELLYTLPDFVQIIGEFAQKMKKGSLFIASHRPIGYYIYRFLRENEMDHVDRIIKNELPAFNAQDEQQLKDLYAGAGFNVLQINPIGMFSGFLKDPFSVIANPKKMTNGQLVKLRELETDPHLQSLFGNCARYLLVIATPNQGAPPTG